MLCRQICVIRVLKLGVVRRINLMTNLVSSPASYIQSYRVNTFYFIRTCISLLKLHAENLFQSSSKSTIIYCNYNLWVCRLDQKLSLVLTYRVQKKYYVPILKRGLRKPAKYDEVIFISIPAAERAGF